MKRIWFVYRIPPIDLWSGSEGCSLLAVNVELFEAAKRLGWDGDIRGEEDISLLGKYTHQLARFAVPDATRFLQGFAWKQDKSGTTFVASPVRLEHLEQGSNWEAVELEATDWIESYPLNAEDRKTLSLS